MGKKRIVKKGGEAGGSGSSASSSRGSKRKLDTGILMVEATYNNTKVSLADPMGNVVLWSSSGSLGFAGAKKGTPFAAAKVGELLADKAGQMGVREVSVVVKGVGAGRESSIRAFTSKGIHLSSIKDMTPVPHNGPRPPKARRV
ncbi:MAG TPA: 30S ribosomal protein S11 [Candidatus Paceibacterota bacterium]|nr:30S ribosomal protein S11 [Candidatus Paceibacterota bacterium]